MTKRKPTLSGERCEEVFKEQKGEIQEERTEVYPM
jgi:hypothetical protein